MKRIGEIVAAAALLAAAVLCSPVIAGVDVHITITPPVPLVIPAPPPLVLIPGTYAYAAPDVEADILFFQGYWYRPYHDGWYRSDSYNGRWVLVPQRRVPMVLQQLPPNWRQAPPGHQRIPYGQVKKNWRQWEREKHWDRAEGRHERFEERRERGHGEEHGEGHGRGRGREKHDND